MRFLYRKFGFVSVALILSLVVRVNADSPLSPEAAIADFQLPARLRVKLVAAEPEVIDPVAIAFDEDGRLWVVEMRDYPTLPPGKQPSSRIRVLRDLDDDDRYETATTFANGLLFPTGLQPWRGGVIVTLAGEVAYFPDENRDDRADEKQVWYRGFATQNEQLRANHPTLGMDGLVYVAGGLRGGEIVNVRDPKSPPISINGRDFAFDPITGRCEAVTGNGQFGLSFDEHGRRFTCSNRNPLLQVMIEQRYLKHNPQLVLPAVVHDVAAAGDASRLYPRTRALTTANSHAGQFTAACGVEIFQGEGLPNWYRNNAFICEPTANLVHREEINFFGVAFSSRPIPKSGEFLTSTDEWFRPVDLANGPDGALYVVDMYRAVIEHPHWMPEELRNRADLRHGNDRGRIYRIGGIPYADTSLPMDRDPQSLVELLKHRNLWQRETAARLIRESGTADTKALRDLPNNIARPGTRTQALWLLQAFDELDEPTLLQALSNISGVREQALILAEPRLPESASLREAALQLINDGNARLGFQLALSLSYLPAESIVDPLEQIALRNPTDVWTCRAVALASRDQAASLLAGILQRASTDNLSVEKLHTLIAELAAATVANGDPPATVDLLSQFPNLSEPLARELLLALATAMESRGESFAPTLQAIELKHIEAHAAILRLFDTALNSVNDDSIAQDVRVEALRLLRDDLRPKTTETLLRLISHDSPAIQTAAVESHAGRATPQVIETVLENFPEQLPSVRRASLDLLLTTNESALALLKAIESERISDADIDALRAERLLKHENAEVSALAGHLLGLRSLNRAEVVQHYQSVLSLGPNLSNGRKVFASNCAACHRLNGEGTPVGPDIGDSALRPPAQLLADILQPNLAVDANYVAYTAVTQDGRVHQGVIRTESDEGIVLQTAEGKSITIPRQELESLHSSGTSLMPEGLERQISPQQMADLIGYLRNWRDTGVADQ